MLLANFCISLLDMSFMEINVYKPATLEQARKVNEVLK